jgi:hypothetical protein
MSYKSRGLRETLSTPSENKQPINQRSAIAGLSVINGAILSMARNLGSLQKRFDNEFSDP